MAVVAPFHSTAAAQQPCDTVGGPSHGCQSTPLIALYPERSISHLIVMVTAGRPQSLVDARALCHIAAHGRVVHGESTI